jgi:hypothetical protein
MKKRIQSQDKPQTKIRVARKRTRLVKLFEEGKSVRQAAATLKKEGFTKGTAIGTVHADLKIIQGDFSDRLPKAREDAYKELQQLKKMVAREETMRTGEKVQSHLAIHDRVARLLGLDAPTRSLAMNVTTSPERLNRYEQFNQATKFIADGDNASWAKLFEFAKTLCSPPTLTAALLPEGKNEEAQ